MPPLVVVQHTQEIGDEVTPEDLYDEGALWSREMEVRICTSELGCGKQGADHQVDNQHCM